MLRNVVLTIFFDSSQVEGLNLNPHLLLVHLLILCMVGSLKLVAAKRRHACWFNRGSNRCYASHAFLARDRIRWLHTHKVLNLKGGLLHQRWPVEGLLFFDWFLFTSTSFRLAVA